MGTQVKTILVAVTAALVLVISTGTSDAAFAKNGKAGGAVSAGGAKKLGCHRGKDANGNLVLICS